MMDYKQLKEGLFDLIKEQLDDDILLTFWTHEKCPTGINEGFEKCDVRETSTARHERCMPCWKEWLDALANKITESQLTYLSEQGVVKPCRRCRGMGRIQTTMLNVICDVCNGDRFISLKEVKGGY